MASMYARCDVYSVYAYIIRRTLETNNRLRSYQRRACMHHIGNVARSSKTTMPTTTRRQLGKLTYTIVRTFDTSLRVSVTTFVNELTENKLIPANTHSKHISYSSIVGICARSASHSMSDHTALVLLYAQTHKHITLQLEASVYT